MNDFTFQNPTKVYFGVDQLRHLSEEVKKYGDRVLLVYGGGSIKKIGLYDRIMAELNSHDIQVFELPGVEPNPHHTTVNKGAALCRKHNINVLLAVGGGSTIDCSKGIAATALSDTDDVWNLVTGKATYNKALPVFAIPTLASTGSEMDKSCQIANTDLGVKSGLSSDLIRPKVSFLNPANTYSVSKFQTACGGFDIMCHLLDCNYFVNSDKYPLQFNVVESILRTVREQLPVALEQPDNYEARATLLWAASWALNSFCTSGFKSAATNHNMEQFSAVYNMTHGQALAILVPRWMRYLLDKDQTVAEDFARFGKNVMGCPVATDSASVSEDTLKEAENAITALETFVYETLGLHSHLADFGVDESRFAEIANRAVKGNCIKGYRVLNAEDVENIYRMCL